METFEEQEPNEYDKEAQKIAEDFKLALKAITVQAMKNVIEIKDEKFTHAQAEWINENLQVLINGNKIVK